MKMIGSLIVGIFSRPSANPERLRRLLLAGPAFLVGACLANAASAAPKYEISPKCKEDPTRLVEVIFEGDYRVRMRYGAPTAVGRKQFRERSRESLHRLGRGTWFAMHRLRESDVDRLVERARRTSPQLAVPDLNNAFVFLAPPDLCLTDTVRALREIPEIRFAYAQPRFVPAAYNNYTQEWGQDNFGSQLAYQQYLYGETLGGLSVNDARAEFSGAGGRKVNIFVHESEADIWSTYNLGHEGLQGVIGPGDYVPDYSPSTPAFGAFKLMQHGTQTLGMLAGELYNGHGVQGIANLATTHFVETDTSPGTDRANAEETAAIYESISSGACADPVSASSECDSLPGQILQNYANSNMAAGDVVLIEKQMCPTSGPNALCGGSGQIPFTPVEWAPAMWSVIRTLTALDIVVVEPAGNGYVNLDDPIYNDITFVDANDPNVKYPWNSAHYPFKVAGGMPVQDSGALMVGASTAGTDWGSGYTENGSTQFYPFPEGVPLNFSNHGKRVDFRAWGEGVVTTGTTVQGSSWNNASIANLGLDNVENAEYTGAYGGTSAASPMIAGVTAALQGVRVAALDSWASGERLSPQRIRNLLRATGTTFSMSDISPALAAQVTMAGKLNPGAFLGPRPNLHKAVQGVGRLPDEYCYLTVPEPRFALEDNDGDGQVVLDESSDLLETDPPDPSEIKQYFRFRPIMPSVPPSSSYVAWSTDGSEPTCRYPGDATCTDPASPQHNQRVYSHEQDSNDYSGIPVYRESYGFPELLTLPITIKAKTTIVTQSCGVRTSDTVEINYGL